MLLQFECLYACNSGLKKKIKKPPHKQTTFLLPALPPLKATLQVMQELAMIAVWLQSLCAWGSEGCTRGIGGSGVKVKPAKRPLLPSRCREGVEKQWGGLKQCLWL